VGTRLNLFVVWTGHGRHSAVEEDDATRRALHRMIAWGTVPLLTRFRLRSNNLRSQGFVPAKIDGTELRAQGGAGSCRRSIQTSAAAADNQLAIEFGIEILLLPLPG
jgi:hypothetical protein